jgi:hypothetical protein
MGLLFVLVTSVTIKLGAALLSVLSLSFQPPLWHLGIESVEESDISIANVRWGYGY